MGERGDTLTSTSPIPMIQGFSPEDPGAAPAKQTVRLSDVHDAIDVVGEAFRGYYSLSEAATMLTLEPRIQHDWLAPFREPWIPASGPQDRG